VLTTISYTSQREKLVTDLRGGRLGQIDRRHCSGIRARTARWNRSGHGCSVAEEYPIRVWLLIRPFGPPPRRLTRSALTSTTRLSSARLEFCRWEIRWKSTSIRIRFHSLMDTRSTTSMFAERMRSRGSTSKTTPTFAGAYPYFTRR